MITLRKYTADLEDYYATIAIKKLKEGVDDSSGNSFFDMVCNVLRNYSDYFPKKIYNLSDDEEMIRRLLLLEFADIKEIKGKLDACEYYGRNLLKNELIDKATSEKNKFSDCYSKIIQSKRQKKKLSVRMTQAQNLRVCPYCNHDWITSRGPDVAGVQMDHFYPKSEYPILSLCMYNLIPSCGSCNQIKLKKDPDQDEYGCYMKDTIISPFDEAHALADEINFIYNPANDKVMLLGAASHVKRMKLEEAYEMNSQDAKELQKKIQMYSKTQVAEIMGVLNQHGQEVSESDIYRSIFGNLFTDDAFSNTPIGKMKADLFKKWAGFTF